MTWGIVLSGVRNARALHKPCCAKQHGAEGRRVFRTPAGVFKKDRVNFVEIASLRSQ